MGDEVKEGRLGANHREPGIHAKEPGFELTSDCAGCRWRM